MLAAEARQVAARWLDGEIPAIRGSAGFAGAYVMGSLARKADGDRFDELASDIDVAIVADPDILQIRFDRYPHGKAQLYDGCLVQSIFVPRDALEDEAKLFAMLGLGDNLRDAWILADPLGVLATAIEHVREGWAEPHRALHRTERAIHFAGQAVDAVESAGGDAERLQALCEAATQLSGLVAIAHAVTPTHRRSLALARGLLLAAGRLDLHERLLSLVSAQGATERDVADCLSDALALLTIELQYPDPALVAHEGMADHLRAATQAGVQELVDEGLVREAMLPALSAVAFSAARVEQEGTEQDRAMAQEVVKRRLPTAGAADLSELLDELAELCRAVAAVPQRARMTRPSSHTGSGAS